MSYVNEFRNRGELLKAIEEYRKKEQGFAQQIRKERLEFQRLQLKKNALRVQIRMVQEEIAKLKESLGSMEREK